MSSFYEHLQPSNALVFIIFGTSTKQPIPKTFYVENGKGGLFKQFEMEGNG